MKQVIGIDPEVVIGRRRLIRELAPCEGCGASLADCKAQRGKDPTAPDWFGCCARGTGMAPCAHPVDPRMQAMLLDEIEAGHVRPAEEIRAAIEARRGKPMSIPARFDQAEWWRRKTGEWVKVAGMSPGHRYNTAAMLMREADVIATRYSAGFSVMAAMHDGGEMAHEALGREASDLHERAMRDPRGWLRTTVLYKALTDGLTVQGDGTQPWQKTGRDPVTGEPTEVPPPMRRACEIPTCGCSGEAHA
jgi:hypothetical protein